MPLINFSKKPENRITGVKAGVIILLFIGTRKPLDDAQQTYWVIHPLSDSWLYLGVGYYIRRFVPSVGTNKLSSSFHGYVHWPIS